MGALSRCLLVFAKLLLKVVISFLGEEAPAPGKRRPQSIWKQTTETHRNHPQTQAPESREQTTKLWRAEIKKLKRENKDLRRELAVRKFEHPKSCIKRVIENKHDRLTSSWSDVLDKPLPLTFCTMDRGCSFSPPSRPGSPTPTNPPSPIEPPSPPSPIEPASPPSPVSEASISSASSTSSPRREVASQASLTDVEVREDLLSELKVAREDNARLRHYISDVTFMIMDHNPGLFEK